MVRCGSCLQENRDGATTCRRCASPIRPPSRSNNSSASDRKNGAAATEVRQERMAGQNRGTRARAQRLSAAVAAVQTDGTASSAAASSRDQQYQQDHQGLNDRQAPGAAINVRGRMISILPTGQDDVVYWLEDDQIDIGRQQGNIRIDDPQLAPRHARLNLTLGGAILTPLDRRNGVYLKLRSQVELSDGDHILLGRQVLRFEVLPEHERRPRPAIEDGVVLFGTPSPAAWGRLRQLTSSGLGRDLYHLSRADITMGREHADLVFADDEFLSRRHAQLSVVKGKPMLQDLGSSNGTYLRLRAPQVLVPGDMIRLGDQLLRFELG